MGEWRKEDGGVRLVALEEDDSWLREAEFGRDGREGVLSGELARKPGSGVRAWLREKGDDGVRGLACGGGGS